MITLLSQGLKSHASPDTRLSQGTCQQRQNGASRDYPHNRQASSFRSDESVVQLSAVIKYREAATRQAPRRETRDIDGLRPGH